MLYCFFLCKTIPPYLFGGLISDAVKWDDNVNNKVQSIQPLKSIQQAYNNLIGEIKSKRYQAGMDLVEEIKAISVSQDIDVDCKTKMNHMYIDKILDIVD